MRRFSIAVTLSTLLLVSISSAQQASTTAVPNLIRYSGTLKDAAGAPVGASIAATTGVTFAIYKQQDGGAAVWMETQNVTPDASGQYSVVLGSTTATGLPSDLFSQEEQRWLGVQVQGQPEQARVLLVSVPYAFKAHEAETLGGLPASAFVQAAPTDASPDGSNGWNAPSNAGGPGGTLRTKGKTASGKPNTSAPCVTMGGAGTLNFIPLWTPDGCTLGSSLISQLTSGRVDVNGNFNLASSASAYQIGANNVLGIGSSTDYNLFLGVGAGAHNVAGSGMFNVFSGYRAGYGNTSGTDNTFSGYKAGFSNATGQANAFFKLQAGYSNTRGAGNVFSGYNAGFSNATGSFNVFSGYKAGDSNIGGAYNTFVGYAAGNNSNACCNTFAGSGAGDNNITGSSNIYIGNEGPSTGTESNAIRIGTDGIGNFKQHHTYIAGISGATTNSGVPVFVDSTGKLGTAGGSLGGVRSFNGRTGAVVPAANDYSFSQLSGLLSSAQFSGSYGNAVTLSNTANVFYGDGSHLSGTGGCGAGPAYRIQNGTSQPPNASLNITGTGVANGFTSWTNYRLGDSVRFKEQVQDMGDSTSGLLKLRPVTFLNKPEWDKGTRTLQYGLIAEEVAKVYPGLVANDNEGQPYSVRYQYLAPMLLNEVQKQYQRAEAEAKVITKQQDEIDMQHRQIEDLQQRLSRLETLVGAQAKIAQGASPSAGTR